MTEHVPSSPDGLPGDGAAGVPEYLDESAGTRVTTSARVRGRGGLRGLLIGGTVVGGLALAGAGTWAALSLAGSGPQPATALPADTLGYVSVDLDPSASQKIEAMKMLNKFPSFAKEFGLNPTDDLRRALFDRVQGTDACPKLSFADDIAPWLGSRAAVAAVAGDKAPNPVLVIQVSDEAAAEQGLTKIRDCGAGSGADAAGAGTGGDWVVANGWAVVAETGTIAQSVVDDARQSSLSDDPTYRKWVAEVGDPGVVSMYAAPAAAQQLLDLAGSQAQGSALGGGLLSGSPASGGSPLSDFGGMAGTVRFNNGALEVEVAGQGGMLGDTLASAGGGGADLVSSLPDDTAAAVGLSLPKGWLAGYVEKMASMTGADKSSDDLFAELSAVTGLDLPGDLETLTGDSVALAVGSDLNPDAIANSNDGSEIPVALKVRGDSTGIEKVLDKLRSRMGSQDSLLGSDADGDAVVIGPNAGYRSELLKRGSLGDTAAFRDAVPNAAEASSVFFVNFDAGDGWLAGLAGGDANAADNLAPLSALGLTSWRVGNVSHGMFRLTTD